jgi:hypothetical protein
MPIFDASKDGECADEISRAYLGWSICRRFGIFDKFFTGM